ADGPARRRAGARPAFPFGADFRQVVGEHVGRAAAVRAVHDVDVARRQRHAFVGRGDGWVIPLLDLAEVDAGDGFGRELQVAGDALNVVGEDDGAEYRRNVQELALGFGELIVFHRSVRAAEVHSLFRDLLNAGARAYRLIVESHAGVSLVIFVEPLLVNGIGEGRAGALDARLAAGAGPRAAAGQ